VWALVYRWVSRATALYLTRGEPEAAVYLRGGVGAGDFTPGLSDVDLTVVLAEDAVGRGLAGERVRRRWSRLARVLPPVTLLLDGPRIHEGADLAELVGTSVFTYGLEEGRNRPARPSGCFGEARNLDRVRTLTRPGLYGSTADWRPLKGPDLRPAEPPRDAQLRRIAAWLELAYWWRLVFPAAVKPPGIRLADMCVKFVAEPARIWLLLAHGERAAGRADALQRTLRRLPAEEEGLRRALALRRSLADPPQPYLAEVLPTMVRLSSRIAATISAEIAEQGATEVRLAGADPATLVAAGGAWQPTPLLAEGQVPSLVPLTDWRSMACAPPPDDSLGPLHDDPADPAVLAAAAVTQPTGPYPALRAEGLMIMPGLPWLRTRLRAIQCQATDPVSFALLEGERVAMFPAVRGWSAEDTARRAVAEHEAWLAAEPGARRGDGGPEIDGPALGTLLTAARAGLFLHSIREGEPQLALTVTETARQVAARSSAARGVIEEALERYREFALVGKPPPPNTLTATRELVLELPAYAEPEAISVRRGSGR
jgi:hypothetical protein